GLALELVMSLWYVSLWHTLRDHALGIAKPNLRSRIASLFRNPVARRDWEDGEYHLHVDGPLVCFNMFHMMRELGRRPQGAREVHLHLSNRVPLVDHTTCDSLRHYLEDFNSSEDGPCLAIDGWDRTLPLSKHEAGMRVALASADSIGSTVLVERERELLAESTD